MLVGFTSTVSGGGNPHQSSVQTILHIAPKDAIFNQRRACRRGAFIIDGERSSPSGEGPVIHDRTEIRGDFFSDPSRESRSALAVEIAFKSMADGFMKKNAGPAGSKDHRHTACWSLLGFKIDQSLTHRLAGKIRSAIPLKEIPVVGSTAATRTPLLAALAIKHDDTDVQANQWPDIRLKLALLIQDQNHLMAPGEADKDLFDSGVEGPALGIQTPE